MQDPAKCPPDERALLEHLESAPFQAGVDAGWWRLFTCGERSTWQGGSPINWPHAFIAVSAAVRADSPTEYVLRFELSGYPQAAPTAGLWDCSRNCLLAAEFRPKGERAASAFRTDWEGGRALYAPYDRAAIDHWPRRYPQYEWHARRDLTFYLTNVFELLNDDDYLGV